MNVSIFNVYHFEKLITTINIELRNEVQKKVDKLMEPPPVKAPKPLPKPDDAPRKKRGGRRLVLQYSVLILQPYIVYNTNILTCMQQSFLE